MLRKNRCLGIGILFCCLTYSGNASPSFDFDGDGYSDPVLIAIARDGSLSWRAQLSGSESGISLGSIGENGDNAIFGPWTAPDSAEIGVVSPTSDGKVEWQILDESKRAIMLGEVDGEALSGVDLNNNGTLDAVVVNKAGRRAIWNVHLDPFVKDQAMGTPQVRRIAFGKWGDIRFFAPLPNGGAALGTISRNSKGHPVIQKYDLSTDTITTQRRISRFFAARDLSRPEAIRGADGTIRLLITRKQQSTVQLYVYSLTGRRYTRAVLPINGDMIIGDFGPDAGEEVGVQQGRNLAIYNPSSGSIITRAIGEGILIDENNNNIVAAQVITPPSSGGSQGGASTPVDMPSVGEVANCASIATFPSSYIYKMVGSNHFSPTDVRRNTIGLVIRNGGPGPFPICISVVNTSGNVLANLGLYERGNGWEARYYAGFGCGSQTPYNGQTIAEMARQSGNGPYVLFNMGTICYGPIDASQCVGSSQC